jgi:hypothetical protein
MISYPSLVSEIQIPKAVEVAVIFGGQDRLNSVPSLRTDEADRA